MIELHRITLRGGVGLRAGVKFEAFIVPDTEELLAIDERYPADPDDAECPEAEWWITHIPTMHAVHKSGFTEAETREAAIAIAQCFYQECKRRHWPIASEDPSALVLVHNALPAKERLDFWNRLQAAGEQSPTTGDTHAKDHEPPGQPRE